MNGYIEELVADSRQPCDCVDCDGEWCVWCLEHHGKKACPFVRQAMQPHGVLRGRS